MNGVIQPILHSFGLDKLPGQKTIKTLRGQIYQKLYKKYVLKEFWYSRR